MAIANATLDDMVALLENPHGPKNLRNYLQQVSATLKARDPVSQPLTRPPEMLFHSNAQLSRTPTQTLTASLYQMWTIRRNLFEALKRTGFCPLLPEKKPVAEEAAVEIEEEEGVEGKKEDSSTELLTSFPSDFNELLRLILPKLNDGSMTMDAVFRWGIDSSWEESKEALWKHPSESLLGPYRVLYLSSAEAKIGTFRQILAHWNVEKKIRRFVIVVEGKLNSYVRKTTTLINSAHDLGFSGLNFTVRLFRAVELLVDRFGCDSVPEHIPMDAATACSILRQMHIHPEKHRRILPILSSHDIIARLLDLKHGDYVCLIFSYPNMKYKEIRLVQDVAASIHNPSPKAHPKEVK